MPTCLRIGESRICKAFRYRCGFSISKMTPFLKLETDYTLPVFCLVSWPCSVQWHEASAGSKRYGGRRRRLIDQSVPVETESPKERDRFFKSSFKTRSNKNKQEPEQERTTALPALIHATGAVFTDFKITASTSFLHFGISHLGPSMYSQSLLFWCMTAFSTVYLTSSVDLQPDM